LQWDANFRQVPGADGGTTLVFMVTVWGSPAFVWGFLQEEQGQDLIEYTLLISFVALASGALFIGAGGQAHHIWTDAGTWLEKAVSLARGNTKQCGRKALRVA